MKKILGLICVLFMMSACSSTMCNTCQNRHEQSYVVSQPVEVIYRNTTYKTVYEPKTYKKVTYEKKPYSNCYRQNNVNYCK